MAKGKIVLKRGGVRALLRSAEISAACQAQAIAICGRCGDGYKTDVYKGTNRVNAMVWADTYKAKRDNWRNNTLVKAIK